MQRYFNSVYKICHVNSIYNKCHCIKIYANATILDLQQKYAVLRFTQMPLLLPKFSLVRNNTPVNIHNWLNTLIANVQKISLCKQSLLKLYLKTFDSISEMYSKT